MSNKRPEIVVITGASAGVGRATAKLFGKRGAWIGLIARDRHRLETARDEIEAEGGRALALVADVADPEALLPRIRNAGAVFVGCSPVVGDYAAGATHVLPTGGLARATGGLGLEAFLKPLQIVTASDEGQRGAAAVVGPLARVEGLPLHAAAVAP